MRAAVPLYDLSEHTSNDDVITALDAGSGGAVYVGTRHGLLLRLVLDDVDAFVTSDDDDDDDDDDNNVAHDVHTTPTARATASQHMSSGDEACVTQLRLLQQEETTTTTATDDKSDAVHSRRNSTDTSLLFVLCDHHLAAWRATTLTHMCNVTDERITTFDVVASPAHTASSRHYCHDGGDNDGASSTCTATCVTVCAAMHERNVVAVYVLDTDKSDNGSRGSVLRALLYREHVLREPAQSLLLAVLSPPLPSHASLLMSQQQQQPPQPQQQHDACNNVVCVVGTRSEYVLLSFVHDMQRSLLQRRTASSASSIISISSNDEHKDVDSEESGTIRKALLARDVHGDVYVCEHDTLYVLRASAHADDADVHHNNNNNNNNNNVDDSRLRLQATNVQLLSSRRRGGRADNSHVASLCAHFPLLALYTTRGDGVVVSQYAATRSRDEADTPPPLLLLPRGGCHMAFVRDVHDARTCDGCHDDADYRTCAALCVATATRLSLVVLPSLRHQLSRLVARDAVDVAVALAAAVATRVSGYATHTHADNNSNNNAKAASLQREMQRMVGFAQLRRGDVSTALPTLLASGADVREVLMYVRECVPPPPPAYSAELRALLASNNSSNSSSSANDGNVSYWDGWHGPCRYNRATATAHRATRATTGQGVADNNIDDKALTTWWRAAYAAHVAAHQHGDDALVVAGEAVLSEAAYVRRTWAALKRTMLHCFRHALLHDDDDGAVVTQTQTHAQQLRRRALSYAVLVLLLERRDHRAVYALVAHASTAATAAAAVATRAAVAAPPLLSSSLSPRRHEQQQQQQGACLYVCDCYDLLVALREYRLLALLLHRSGYKHAAATLLRQRVLLSSYCCPRTGAMTALPLSSSSSSAAAVASAIAARVRAQTRWWFTLHKHNSNSSNNSCACSDVVDEGVVGAGLLGLPPHMRVQAAVQLLHLTPPTQPHTSADDTADTHTNVAAATATTEAVATYVWLQRVAAQLAERAQQTAAAVYSNHTKSSNNNSCGDNDDGGNNGDSVAADDDRHDSATLQSCAELFYLVDKADVASLRDVLLLQQQEATSSSSSRPHASRVCDAEGSTLLHVACGLLLCLPRRDTHRNENSSSNDDNNTEDVVTANATTKATTKPSTRHGVSSRATRVAAHVRLVLALLVLLVDACVRTDAVNVHGLTCLDVVAAAATAATTARATARDGADKDDKDEGDAACVCSELLDTVTAALLAATAVRHALHSDDAAVCVDV